MVLTDAGECSLTGLLPGTTYYYRVVAINEDGTVYGPDQTFTTLGFLAMIIQAF